MQKDFIITLAWPEGVISAAGSWYDILFSKNGKYRVGHSAIVLISATTNKAHYFDFGRYHSKEGYGRVRDIETDPDTYVIDAKITNGKVENIKDILLHLSDMKSSHGEGKLYASVINNIDFNRAFCYAKNIQNRGMLPYGPFVRPGTNCSRFVANVIKSSGASWIKRLRLTYPFCISPSPKRNVCIVNNHYYIAYEKKCTKIKKTKLKAYFSSIEV